MLELNRPGDIMKKHAIKKLNLKRETIQPLHSQGFEGVRRSHAVAIISTAVGLSCLLSARRAKLADFGRLCSWNFSALVNADDRRGADRTRRD